MNGFSFWKWDRDRENEWETTEESSEFVILVFLLLYKKWSKCWFEIQSLLETLNDMIRFFFIDWNSHRWWHCFEEVNRFRTEGHNVSLAASNRSHQRVSIYSLNWVETIFAISVSRVANHSTPFRYPTLCKVSVFHVGMSTISHRVTLSQVSPHVHEFVVAQTRWFCLSLSPTQSRVHWDIRRFRTHPR